MTLRLITLLLWVVPMAQAEDASPAGNGTPFSAVQALMAPEPDHRIEYGTQPSQFVELWVPPDGNAPPPVLVLVHGGCWLSAFGVDHIRPLAAALVRAGYAVWAPEYRRVGEPGGGDPGTLDDMRAALAALATRAPVSLDLDRVVLVGHSAGGHLALWLAAQQREGLPVVRGAVGLAAITDLAAYAALEGSCPPATLQFMDATPQEKPERYRSLSPAFTATPVPVVLLQGKLDHIVPLSQARAMPTAELRRIDGAGHFDLIYPPSPAFAVLLEALENLLDV